MSYKAHLIRLLDRPGTRFLLGKVATQYVKRFTNGDIEIRYLEGFWTRRVGNDFFPDSPRFDYKHAYFDDWTRQMERYTADTSDYWLQYYHPRQGDTVIDVGAGRGEDTVVFSKLVGAEGRVVAIESDPLSFALLSKFCGLNRLRNVTLLHAAVMDRPGTVRSVSSGSSWTENTVQPDDGHASGIQARTIDDICATEKIEQIAFLKMNIEGAERNAVLGMRNTLSRVEQLCIACHDFRAQSGHGERFRTRAFVEKLLLDYGFTLESRPHDPRDFVRDHVFGLRHWGDIRH